MSTLMSLLAEGERLFIAERATEAARAVFERALAEAEREHGENHEALIMPLWWLSKVARYRQDSRNDQTALAVAYGARALRLAEEHWQTAPWGLPNLLEFHATTLHINEDIDEAIVTAARAATLLRDAGRDPRAPLQTQVEVLMFAGRGEEGIEPARELLGLEQAHDGLMTWYAHYLLLNCLRIAGRDAEALERARDFVAREGKEAADSGYKDLVRPMVVELERRIREKQVL